VSTFAARVVAVVEDDEAMRLAISRLLESEGYVTEAFASAEAFLASDAQSRADCVVLDIHLPGMSGIELHDRLTTAGAARPTVFITAHDDKHLRRRVMQRAECLLTKPFLGETLIQAVARSVAARGRSSP
jgi:FixJ family two-component response regulator